MADEQLRQTSPKPFVFVLMPFDSAFHDTYTFGIRGAAEDAGAYAERVDEQIFQEGMMDRVYNEISKADVIVADMSGRNPNVFYEVGYAHALNKIVLLLTKDADDIPFDLKHRQHIVYGDSIETLRAQLAPRIRWAVEASKQREKPGDDERFRLTINATDIPVDSLKADVPTIHIVVPSRSLATYRCEFTAQIHNENPEPKSLSYMYLFLPAGALIRLASIMPPILTPHPNDLNDRLRDQLKLPVTINALPPGAVEPFQVEFSVRALPPPDLPIRATLRVHTSRRFYDYPFLMTWDIIDERE